MEAILAIVIGGLYAAGIYMMLRRSLLKLLIGLGLLSHATNLLIFTSAGLTRDVAPILGDSNQEPLVLAADPLPQALILTAIVIGLGVTAFALALAYQFYRVVGSDDLDVMRTVEKE